MIVIGTSGSTRYLEDTAGRRYWPVAVSKTVLALCPIDGCRLWNDLLAAGLADPIVSLHRQETE